MQFPRKRPFTAKQSISRALRLWVFLCSAPLEGFLRAAITRGNKGEALKLRAFPHPAEGARERILPASIMRSNSENVPPLACARGTPARQQGANDAPCRQAGAIQAEVDG